MADVFLFLGGMILGCGLGFSILALVSANREVRPPSVPVRCKNCRHRDTEQCPLARMESQSVMEPEFRFVTITSDDFYCKKGEKNEQEKL